jgi:hypothetical protein
MLRYFSGLLIAGVCAGAAVPGNESRQPETYTIYINYPAYSVRANVLNDAGKIHAKNGHTYYWYSDNTIKNTEGGFDGRLLHGEYKSFYLDKNLMEQGMFRQGLKTNTWKRWFPGGHIREISHYREGLLDGISERYNEEGKLISRAHFKNGVQHGKTIIYSGDKIDSTIQYKRGQRLPAPKKSQKSKVKRTVAKDKADSLTRTQDTTAKAPKSRNKAKKVFNKDKKIVPENQPSKEKKATEKKKRSSDRKNPSKSS